ncbi:hypothetical protein RGUI_1587 [Rhodovulum sp. P5]|uniref:FeoC-like transcriptional regulator n=1 Tax=Rhodovulum sp. P5 TaxID=1564506 RepID=UPI0009C3DF01|nr:FeoC-like transcriptional regulator [Rhodovulum sp. P5]ARE39728.1 hypothetical protein RGUI_1587 [Rhodovulum sp. P5]
MLLSDIRSYCAEAQNVSLQELSNRFDTDPEAMRGMMEVLEGKGMIRSCGDAPARSCGGCRGCSLGCGAQAPFSDATYQWVGRARRKTR